MSDQHLLTALEEERASLAEQIQTLQDELRLIDRAIQRRKAPLQQLTLAPSLTSDANGKQGPKDALAAILQSSGEKWWHPVALRDELAKLREAGKLDSQAMNLTSTVHWVLWKLIKNQQLETTKRGGKRLYRWKQDLPSL